MHSVSTMPVVAAFKATHVVNTTYLLHYYNLLQQYILLMYMTLP